MKTELPTRRIILRGALAAGYSLFVPFGFPSLADAAPADALKKMPQATVRYQTQPKGERKCSGCVNFIAESKSCKRVDGQISSDGWCNLWTKKV